MYARAHLNYIVSFMTPHETPFVQKMELIQYKAALDITGTLTGNSTVNL